MTHRFPRVLTALVLAVALTCFGGVRAAFSAAPDDTTKPVRPGEPGVRPFWNLNGLRFIYAPAFDFPKVDGASKYRFTLINQKGKAHTFTADQPWAPLSRVWGDVPEGYTTLKVEGLDDGGKAVGIAGERSFYRSPGFPGTAEKPIRPYDEASRDGLKALFERPHVQHWLTGGKPDPSYARYCYPNKVIGGLLRGMTAYSQSAEKEEDRATALKIARATADYLLSLRYPADAAYANVAPTYANNVTKVAGEKGLVAERLEARWLMVPSIVDAVFGYLDLYDVTKDQKYFDAAKQAAQTLVKTQESDGTWPLMVDWKTGKAITDHRQIPTWVIFLFDRLQRQYKVNDYNNSRQKAWQFIVANPLETYRWDAQFEDVKLRPPYMNLAREQACDVAVLLLSDPNRTEQHVKQAEDLIRFSEDQFVCWAPVADVEGWRKAMPQRYKNVDEYILPGVFEQYVCYGPVARSGAIMIHTYLKAHAVTGNPAYLEKARGIGNGMLAGQKDAAENYGTNGEIPTWGMRRKPINWLNNSFYAAQSLQSLADYESKLATAAKR